MFIAILASLVAILAGGNRGADAAAVGVPAAPTALTVTGKTATSISLAWSAPSGSGKPITDYRVEYSTDRMAWQTFDDGVSTSTTTTVTGLVKGTPYYFRVSAANNLGTGAPTEFHPLSIATDFDSTCALAVDRTVRCWGSNGIGQLGDGTFVDSGNPVTATGISNATAITGGGGQYCALLGDRTIKCWGYDYIKEVGFRGDGSSRDISTPVPTTVSGITNATAVTTDGTHTCALLEDRTVSCWGKNSDGQLGNGTRTGGSTPVAVTGLTNAIAISAGDGFTCALIADGTIRCWGLNNSQQLGYTSWGTLSVPTPVAISGVTNATAISASGRGACALLNDGTVRCWGLGYSKLGDSNPLVAIDGISNATAITDGSDHACALLSDGTVRCWGNNEYGQLGNGTTLDSASPVAVVGITDATAISTSGGHTCAFLADGSARCWGANWWMQLGNGSSQNSSVPTPVSESLIFPVIPAVTPSGPTGLTVLGTSSTSISLSWTPPDNGGQEITDYKIEYATDNSTWTTVNDGITPINSSTVTALRNGTGYTFRISAVNAEGTGIPSSTIAASTLPKPPSSPMGFRATPKSAGVVELSWTAPLEDGGRPITGYKIEYDASINGSQRWFYVAVPPTTTTTVTGLSRDVAYNFSVRAVNAVGIGSPIWIGNLIIAAVPPERPLAPAVAVRGTVAGAVTVSWTAPADGGSTITSYVVTATNPNGTKIETSTGSLTASFTRLSPTTSYTFTVRAINAAGSSISSPGTLLTPEVIPVVPTQPKTVSLVSTDNGSITVSYTAPANNGGSPVTGYLVQALIPSVSSIAVSSCESSAATPTCKITGLTNGVKYEIRVFARNVAGTGTIFSKLSNVKAGAPPASPTSPQATTNAGTSVTISWIAPNNNGSAITVYNVSTYTWINNVATLVTNRKCSSTTTSCTITALTAGTQYRFTVTATNAVGTSSAATTTPVVARP